MLKAKESAPFWGGAVKCALVLGLLFWAFPAQSQPKTEHAEMLYTVTQIRGEGGTGSGTVIYSQKREGECHTYVLTNHHVVDDSIKVEQEWDPAQGKKVDRERRSHVRVEWFDYNGFDRPVGTRGKSAIIVAYDKGADLALLRIVDKENCISPVAHLFPPAGAMFIFDPVWALGAGLGKPPFPTYGYLSNLDTTIEGHRYLLSSAPIIFGNSGGALFRHSPERKRYELIGVPSRVSAAGFGSAVSHMAWSIPIDTVYQFLKANKLEFVVPGGEK